MHLSQGADTARNEVNEDEDGHLTASSTANTIAPGVISASRDPGDEASLSNHGSLARNASHQACATGSREGAIICMHSEVGVYIASPERIKRRRPSNSLATGMGGLNAVESDRSWTRAGLLHPRSFRGRDTQVQSASYTAPVESDPRSIGISASGDTASIISRTLTPSLGSQNRTNFFSRTPDDIRASTLELSMLAVPFPRAHSDLVSAAGPSASPSRNAWSPPTSATLEGDGLGSPASPVPFLSPHQLRTPLTAADLARLASAHSAPVSRAPVRQAHVRDLEHTFVSQSPELQSQIQIEAIHRPSTSRTSSSSSGSSSSGSKTPTPLAFAKNHEASSHRASLNVSIPSTPSGLSLLLAQGRSRAGPAPSEETAKPLGSNQEEFVPEGTPRNRARTDTTDEIGAPTRTPTDEQAPLLASSSPTNSSPSRGPSQYYGAGSRSGSPPMQWSWWPWTRRKSSNRVYAQSDNVINGNGLPADLGGSIYWRTENGKAKWIRSTFASVVFSKDTAADLSKAALRSIPAVLLGMLLNILDGVSYGMIMFPSNGIFQDFGGIGVSIFFVTTIISQLVYSFGGSRFEGANGSMMIEVVPFFHILANKITQELGEENWGPIVSTTMAAYALSSVLTGLTFFLLGHLRLGVVIGFFPRHILVGCIGGVGIFLIQTGLAVCVRIDDDEFAYTLEMLKFFFSNGHIIALWMPALALAIILRVITHRFHHQLIFPVYFMLIPVIFYIIVAAAGIDVSTLRRSGWVFDMAGSSQPWYKFYTYFSWENTSFRAIWVTMPTQFALLFFNILHPPLNVPALAVSLNEDVDTNKELVAHGYSNFLAGILGTVPNYLVYVNTLLFYRVGGTTRVAGFMLALATFLLLVIGTAPIGYIPIMLVGALIFVLGIDLVKEALWDTRRRVNQSEYLTIISIMVCMTLWDFVVGVLFGIVVCCFFFVVQNSRRRSIRAMFTGESAMSAVRRPSAHRDYLRQVAKQTIVLRLQGFLFFGTIAQVEEAIRDLVEPPAWQRNPIRFLVIDITLVGGIDMSSAEAFVRVQRLLSSRFITMILCGFSEDSSMGHALRSVGLLEAEGVEIFSKFSDAMEWTENAYLRAWFMCQKSEADTVTKAIAFPGRKLSVPFSMGESFQNSPRRNEIQAAAGRTLEIERNAESEHRDTEGCYAALNKAFSSYGQVDAEQFGPLLRSFKRTHAIEGSILWEQGDPPDGLYLIASGVLRAIYSFPDRKDAFEESMVGGTLAGELSALSNSPRNARVVIEKDAVLWKLSMEALEKLQKEHPDLAQVFTHLVLKVAKTDYDILLSALAARQ